MTGTTLINRRASVHASNVDGVSIPQDVHADNLRPEGKKLGHHGAQFRRRASLQHIDVTQKQDSKHTNKRRGSLTHTSQDADRLKSSPGHPVERLPTLSPSKHPGESTKKLVPKTRGKKKKSPSPPSTPESDEGSSESGQMGWATKPAKNKRQERLFAMLGRKDMSPEARRRELLSPICAVRPKVAHKSMQDGEEPSNCEKEQHPAVCIAGDFDDCGEDLLQAQPDNQQPLSSAERFESFKKASSHPALLESIKPPRAVSADLPDQAAGGLRVNLRTHLSGLEKTLKALRSNLNSEQFRGAFQRMIARPRSARSSRILNLFPDYVRQQNVEAVAQKRLRQTREEIRATLHQSRNAMEISNTLLVKHFKDVPQGELSEYIACFFDAYDVNRNGILEVYEVQQALRDLGKPCSVEDVQEFFLKVEAHDHFIDRAHFEQLVRHCQGWEAKAAPIRASSPLQERRDALVSDVDG